MLAQIVLFDGFDPMDVVGPYEVLYAGGSFADGALTVQLVSAEGAREVPGGAGGLSLRAEGLLTPQHADLVVLPGAAGRVSDADAPDSVQAVLGRALHTGLPALLKEAVDREGLTVTTVCGGSMLLALAGLIAGRPAVTHRQGLGRLGEFGAVPVDARVVDDGDLVTAAGVTSGLDLGLHLLERGLGPRIAHAVEQLFEHERRGVVWRAQGPVPAAV